MATAAGLILLAAVIVGAALGSRPLPAAQEPAGVDVQGCREKFLKARTAGLERIVHMNDVVRELVEQLQKGEQPK